MKGRKIVKGVYILKTVVDRIQKIANKEKRSFSQVASQLIEEGLFYRDSKEEKK